MTRFRTAFVAVALLALAIPLISGATTAADAAQGTGDASAGLVGAHLEVEDLDGLTSGILGTLEVGDLVELEALDTSGLDPLDTAIDLGLLEGATSATTREGPDARATLSPLRIGDERPYDVSAGPGEQEGAEAVAPEPVSALVSGLGVSAFSVSADADDDSATATIDALEADLEALGLTDLDLSLTGVVSEVTPTGSSASQDLSVDGLAIGLGDILPADLLASLPLDALLSLIEELADAGLLTDVDGLRNELDTLVSDINDAIAALNAYDLELLGELETDTDLLQELLTLRDDLEALDLEAVIESLEQTLQDEAEDLLSLNLALDLEAALDEAADLLVADLSLEDEVQELEDAIALLNDAAAIDGIEVDGSCPDDPNDLSEDLGGLIEDAEKLDECVDDVLIQLQGLIEGLLEQLRNEVSAQLGLDGLLELLEGLLEDLADLEDLIGTIRGLVDDIAGLDLLTADTLSLEVAAAADAEGGTTTIACELGGVAILGDALGEVSCDGGSLGEGVDGAVDDALGVVAGVLESLPGVSGVEGLRLDLLPVATEDVSTADDGTVTATAHAVLLELVVPSVTIDPAAALDLLDLDPFEGIAGLETLVDDVLTELDDEGLLDLLPEAELTEVLEGLQESAEDLVGQVEGLLGGLDLLNRDVLGFEVSTPSISLVLDPESEASFTPAAEDDSQVDEDDPGDDPDDPGDDPVPSSDDPTTPATGTPELPKTGGGIALLGLVAMLGAVALRRTD